VAVLVGVLGRAVPGGALDRPTELTLWAMGAEGEAAASIVRDFEAEHPELHVRVQRVPWSAAHEKILTAFVGDALPDVLQVGSTWIPELAAIGVLTSVPGEAGGDEFPGVRAAHSFGGRLYALPWYVDTRVLFYRTDLVAAARVGAPPATWEEWEAALRRVADPPRRYGLFTPTTDWWLPVAFAAEYGAPLLDEFGEHGRFAAPTARRAFAHYVRLFGDGIAPAAGAAEIGNLYDDFAAGYFAAFPSGPWDMGVLARRLPESVATSWATAPMPALRAGGIGTSVVGGSGLGVTRTSRHPDEAWALARHLTEKAQQLALHRLTGDLPARPSAWDEAGLRAEGPGAAFWRQLQHVVPVPSVGEWERIADALGRALDRVIRGEQDLDEALGTLDRDVDVMLEKRRWMRARGRLP